MKYQLAIRKSQNKAAIIKPPTQYWNFVLVEIQDTNYPRSYYVEIHHYNDDGTLNYISANFKSHNQKQLHMHLGDLLDSDGWQPYDNNLTRDYSKIPSWRERIDAVKKVKVKKSPKLYTTEWFLEK